MRFPFQKAAITNAAQEACKNDKGILEAPWACVGKIAEVFTDENKKEVNKIMVTAWKPH